VGEEGGVDEGLLAGVRREHFVHPLLDPVAQGALQDVDQGLQSSREVVEYPG
jgi:hypothetical protein